MADVKWQIADGKWQIDDWLLPYISMYCLFLSAICNL